MLSCDFRERNTHRRRHTILSKHTGNQWVEEKKNRREKRRPEKKMDFLLQ